MNRKQAFIIADHMMQTNRKLFTPEISPQTYVKRRQKIIEELLSDEND